MTDTAIKPRYTADDYIPMEAWGKDHWSMLAYIETVMVECGGFQIGQDPRVRSNRRHFRVMQEQCPLPKRPSRVSANGYGPMPPGKYGTRLADGTEVDGHDDWCCVQDMAVAGLLAKDAGSGSRVVVKAEDIEPRAMVHLSVVGAQIAAALRQHKATGATSPTSAGRWRP